MGYRDATGWHQVVQSNKPVQLKPDIQYDVLVAVNGTNVTVDGQRFPKVGVKLKGGRGSFRALGQKAAFKIDLDRVITSYSIHYTKLYEPVPVAAALASGLS